MQIMYWIVGTLFTVALILGSIVIASRIAAKWVTVSRYCVRLKNALIAIWKPIVGVVACVAVVMLIYTLWDKESPSVESVVRSAQSRWLWILVLTGAVSIAIKYLVPHSGAYQVSLWSAMAVVLVFGNVLVWATSDTARSPRGGIPFSSAPMTEWPKLTIPPNGNSEPVLLESGERIMLAGYDYTNVTVYPNGTECAYVNTPCPNGGVYVYARNNKAETNVVLFARERL